MVRSKSKRIIKEVRERIQTDFLQSNTNRHVEITLAESFILSPPLRIIRRSVSDRLLHLSSDAPKLRYPLVNSSMVFEQTNSKFHIPALLARVLKVKCQRR